MTASPTMEQRRADLIAEMKANGTTLSQPVAKAFQNVPRHLFVPGVYLNAVYRDHPIITRRDKDGIALSSSSRPSTIATMLNALALEPGQNVLEVGTGTGYNAALLAEIVGPKGQVTGLELDAETAENAQYHLSRAGFSRVNIIQADGTIGYAPHAPYDRIMATVRLADIPPAWIEQLATGGILTTALTAFGMQIGVALRKQADGSLTGEALFPTDLLPIQGESGQPACHFFVPGAPLRIDCLDTDSLDAAQVHTLLLSHDEIAQLPAELDRADLGMFSYYLIFHQPAGYAFVTYTIEEGQLAYGMEGFGWGLVSGASACFVPYGDTRIFYRFGGGEAAYLLIELAEQWGRDGRPDLDQCGLHVTPTGEEPFQPADENAIVRYATRPNYSYALWLT